MRPTAAGDRPPEAAQRPVRICSLLPSATEIVGMLGLTSQLVGVSAECDWPAGVRDLPVVSASRVHTEALSSGQIDVAVESAIADGRSLYAIEEDVIERLNPDVVLTQDLCEVCAVSSRELGAHHRVAAEAIPVDARSLAGIARSVRELASRLGVPERGRDVVEWMNSRIDEVRRGVAERARPAVFVCEWLDPPFAGGHWVPEMVAAAGGTPVLGRPGEPSFSTTWQAVRDACPELVVLAPCGFDSERAAREASSTVPELGCPTVAVDANAYFSRPSPRVTDGIAQLAHLLHPGAVNDPGLPSATPRP